MVSERDPCEVHLHQIQYDIGIMPIAIFWASLPLSDSDRNVAAFGPLTHHGDERLQDGRLVQGHIDDTRPNQQGWEIGAWVSIKSYYPVAGCRDGHQDMAKPRKELLLLVVRKHLEASQLTTKELIVIEIPTWLLTSFG